MHWSRRIDQSIRSSVTARQKRRNLPSAPAGICMKLAACRRNLIGFELITYSRALCSRTLLRICQASSGCCSVGSFPISRIAGAVNTSAMLAVGPPCREAPPPEQGSPQCDDGPHCSSSRPRGQTSKAGKLLRSWCASTRSPQSPPRRRARESSANFFPISSNASSHVAGVSFPSLRISGRVSRSS